jgi:hypothetical protein
MITLGVIVEGDGEVAAAPVLLRRIAAQLGRVINVPRPFRVPRGKLVKPRELQRAVEAVARQCGPGAPILVLLDADDDCVKDLAARLLAEARAARADRPVAVVLANREFEAWFLAALDSLRGQRYLAEDARWPGDPEAVRDAKGALGELMAPARYSPSIDQVALASRMDLELARARSRSFDKLCRDVARLLGGERSPGEG